MEIVDIWHFLMSLFIEQAMLRNIDMETLAGLMLYELKEGGLASKVRAALEHRYHEMVTAP